jgi:hypothetical protein
MVMVMVRFVVGVWVKIGVAYILGMVIVVSGLSLELGLGLVLDSG